MNIAKAMENSGQALAAYLQPTANGEVQDKPPNELTELVKTFSAVAEYWLSDPDRANEIQTRIGKAYLDLWGNSVRRLAGEEAAPAIAPVAARQAICRSGMEIEPVLRLHASALFADDAVGATIWFATPRASIRTPARRPSSTSSRSPTRFRPPTSF